jgi:hypothetical protein
MVTSSRRCSHATQVLRGAYADVCRRMLTYAETQVLRSALAGMGGGGDVNVNVSGLGSSGIGGMSGQQGGLQSLAGMGGGGGGEVMMPSMIYSALLCFPLLFFTRRCCCCTLLYSALLL